MRVAHTGTPRTKFCVPSIGSITHCLAAVPVDPSSSPIIPSRVRTRESCARRSSSTSRSTSVTGVPSLLCSTVKDRSLNRDMLTRSTLSARICASLKSSVYDVVKFMNLSLVRQMLPCVVLGTYVQDTSDYTSAPSSLSESASSSGTTCKSFRSESKRAAPLAPALPACT